jgi:hypothetical protein
VYGAASAEAAGGSAIGEAVTSAEGGDAGAPDAVDADALDVGAEEGPRAGSTLPGALSPGGDPQPAARTASATANVALFMGSSTRSESSCTKATLDYALSIDMTSKSAGRSGGKPAAEPSANRGGDRAKWFLLASIAVTVTLFYIPYGRQIGFPIVLVSTVAHEMGHALAALLTGGRVDQVEVFWSGGGVAHTATSGRLASAFTSAGGLVGPAFAGALCFAFARSPRIARATLVFLGGLLALSVLFWVRNAFGLVYVPLLAAILLAVGIRARAEIAQLVLVFVAVQLSLSVYSRGDYLFTEYADFGTERLPSDVANMSSALLLPYWFWGATCAVISGVVLIVGFWLFWRRGPLLSLRRSDARKVIGAGG